MCGGRRRRDQEWKCVGSGPMKMSRMEICAWDTSRYQQGIRVPTEWESQFGRAVGLERENNNYLSTSLLVSSSRGPAAPSRSGRQTRRTLVETSGGAEENGSGWGSGRRGVHSACLRGMLSKFALLLSKFDIPCPPFPLLWAQRGRERVNRTRPDGGLAGIPRLASHLEEQSGPRSIPDPPQNPELEICELLEPPARRCHLRTFSSSWPAPPF